MDGPGHVRCASARLLLLSLLCPITALACLNGGTFDGVKCICPPAYFGPRCEECVDAGLCGTATPTASPAPPTATAMATTATASTATATTATGICQNGGTWLGEVCRCTHYFWGPRCEFVVNVIEVNTAVSAWIDVTVTVTNRRFVAALADPSTEEYRDFAREFTQQRCASTPRPSGPPKGASRSTARICEQAVPAGFGPHFSGRPTEAGYECVTRCAQGRWDSPLCRHGQCQVPISGPQCYCPSTEASWFLGDDCSVHISKVGLSIGLPLSITAALAVALAVVQLRK
ncbi:Mucin-17 [Varanus komodoensis]|nr:Mucin-17 [Varanus komodoensis]